MLSSTGSDDVERQSAAGMVLPFESLTLSFHDLEYYVPLLMVRDPASCIGP